MKAEKNEEFVKKSATLALGEVTGHSHQILEPVLVRENEFGLAEELMLSKSVELVHEEHEVINLPEGKCKVVLQRELDLIGEVRNVLD